MGLERLVPFGNPCVVALPSPEKGKLANRRGRILGLPSDTPGYIVLLDSIGGASPVASEVIASVDVTPRRGGEPWGTDAEGRPAPVEGTSDAGPHTGFVPFPSREQAAGVEATAAASPVPAVSRAPVRQSVGTAPGDAGSRHALLDRAARASPTRGVAAAVSVDEALALITDAMMNGKTFVFIQPNPKRGKSAQRYAVYSAETTFAGLAALRGQHFAGTSRPVLVGEVTARSGDFVNDVCRRYVAFIEAPPPVLAAGVAAHSLGTAGARAAGGGAGRRRVSFHPGVRSRVPADSVPRLGTGFCFDLDAAALWWSARECSEFKARAREWGARPRPGSSLLRRVVSGCRLSLGSADAHLDESERRLLRELREWRGPEAVLSNRASAGVGGFPTRIVQAAVAATSGIVRAAAAETSGLLADASVDRLRASVRCPQRGAVGSRSGFLVSSSELCEASSGARLGVGHSSGHQVRDRWAHPVQRL